MSIPHSASSQQDTEIEILTTKMPKHDWGIMKYVSLFALIVTCSCSQFTANINSLSSDREVRNYNYAILPGDSSISENDLEFLRYSKYLKNSLIANNFHITGYDSANAIIQFKYGATTDPISTTSSSNYLEKDKTTGKYESKTSTSTTTLYPSYILLTALEKTTSKPLNIWKVRADGNLKYYDLPLSIMALIYLAEPYYGNGFDSQQYASLTLDNIKLDKILSDTSRKIK